MEPRMEHQMVQEPKTVQVWKDTVSPPRPCKGCNASIVFAQRVGSDPGRLTPFRAPLEIREQRGAALVIVDTNHFVDCPAATRFRKRK